MSATSDARPGAVTPGSVVETAALGATDSNPFPGPRPFAESDSWLFFGRDRELSDLVALLFAQRAVLLHAPSGAGKSSLVNAGVIPRARERGFEFLPVARVRGISPNGDDPAGNRYVGNVIENWRAAGMDVPSQAADLSEALSGLPPVGEPGRVVVFDQFEELFVLHPERWRDRDNLFTQVQAALDCDPLLHCLFVLRDDYLAQLEPLAPLLRDRLSTRYRLGGLSSPQALDAVVRPFEASGRAFAPGVAEEFVTALRAQPAELGANRSYEGKDIEPVQLQIVCRTFFERLPFDVTVINAEDVARHADVQQALVGFYEQAIAAVAKGHAGVGERKVRLWFERQLITPARTRGIVFRDERTTAGLANQAVDELERRRMIRSEPRGPALWYELTHDRLIDAVLGSNRVWDAKRSRSIIRRTLAAAAAFGLLATLLSFAVIHSRQSRSSGSGLSGPPTPTTEAKGKISAPGQTVDFPVRGRVGQLLTAAMSPGKGFVGELQLFSLQREAVGAPSSPASSHPLLTLALPADGDYQVEARGRGNSTGPFVLTLVVQTVGTEAQLAGPDPIPGSITALDQVDEYTFDGRAGTAAEITMTGEFASRLVLTGPGGQGFNEVGGAVDMIAAVLPRDGSYKLYASSLGKYHPQVGPYRLQLQLLDNIAVQPGQVTGTASDQNRANVRIVRSAVGGALAISYPRHHGLPDEVNLVAANGDTLVSDYGSGGLNWVIAPAITYFLVVSSNDFSNGNSYSLTLAIQEPLPLAGGKAQGKVVRAGQVVTYQMDSDQGDVATILATPLGRFKLTVTIVQPDGTTLATSYSDAGRDDLFSAQLTQRGRHLIAVSTSDSTTTGEFRISVTQHKTTVPPP